MIDSFGGPQRVNNILTTLDLPYIPHKNLEVMERRAGHIIENVTKKSITNSRKTAFQKKMRHVCQDVEFTKEYEEGSWERDGGGQESLCK